jgi:hypothetical protein
MTILIVLLILSAALNFLLLWYFRQIVARFLDFQRESTNLTGAIDSYLEHIQRVYELPMFYGDSTIKGLLNHTSLLKENLGILKEIFDVDGLPPSEEDNEEEKE